MANRVTESSKERLFRQVQATVDYCSRLGSSDSLKQETIDSLKHRLLSIIRDIERACPAVISEAEKNDLLSIVKEMYGDIEKISSTQDDETGYQVNRPCLGDRGTPKFDITKEQLEFLVGYKFSGPMMAELMHTSESTIRRRLREYSIKLRDGKTTDISDEDLDIKVKEIIGTNKRIGPNLIRTRLQMEDIHLTRQRVRGSCHRVDPAGSALRSMERRNIHRRTYKVAGPNSLWHIDGNHKLIRWGFVIHGGIDGFSRLITFLHASNNNKSTTVYDLFIDATSKHGIPSRIRVDHGGENSDICIFMEGYRGADRRSAIRGKSSHNQRIERLWVDLWDSVTNEYYDLFSYMENSAVLDLTSAKHMWAFQYVFLPRVNKSLEIFIYQYNHRGLSTEGNKTPYQLFIQGVLRTVRTDNVSIKDLLLMAGNENTPESVQEDYGQDEIEHDEDIIDVDNENDINVPAIHCLLRAEDFKNLRDTIEPTENYKDLLHGVELFKTVLIFIDSVLNSETSSDD